ncbi:alpha/beta fold hydrolase [Rhodococcus sp. KRD162]|jgi:pimeloyl-ACP methyl ester carboxylesterase|uniref:alpha/beta fold hydrolase n=1 Tax=Rhodococcus sp. KRD162 TaxID=2729725 RepID=UPI0019D115B5|nr:alpha/beta hydrolase [Rhodococcus sp. KRD162]
MNVIDHTATTTLMSGEASTIATEDGVPLRVREWGPRSAPLTVVFSHGFCLQTSTWAPQLAYLRSHWGDEVRLVAYDQRGHGESGTPPAHSCTIDQLGRDVQSILDAIVPSGPTLLVGHSMGGMSILSHARQYPQMIGSRVAAAALISTSARGLATAGLFPIVNTPVINTLRAVSARLPLGSCPLSAVIPPIALDHITYGRGAIPKHVRRHTHRVITSTRLATCAGFLESLQHQDTSDALNTLSTIPTIVACGDADYVTPLRNSIHLVSGLNRDTLFVRIPKAGHLAHLEQPDVVSEAIVALAARSARTAGHGSAPTASVG